MPEFRAPMRGGLGLARPDETMPVRMAETNNAATPTRMMPEEGPSPQGDSGDMVQQMREVSSGDPQAMSTIDKVEKLLSQGTTMDEIVQAPEQFGLSEADMGILHEMSSMLAGRTDRSLLLAGGAGAGLAGLSMMGDDQDQGQGPPQGPPPPTGPEAPGALYPPHPSDRYS